MTASEQPIASRSSARRAFVADTTALILFFTTTGIMNERFVANMAGDQVLHARLLGAVLMVPAGRPYGVWRATGSCSAPDRAASRGCFGSASPVIFQVPIYAAIIAVSGASERRLLMGVAGATIMMLVLGVLTARSWTEAGRCSRSRPVGSVR